MDAGLRINPLFCLPDLFANIIYASIHQCLTKASIPYIGSFSQRNKVFQAQTQVNAAVGANFVKRSAGTVATGVAVNAGGLIITAW